MSINRGTDKEVMVRRYAVEYYSATKQSEIRSFVEMWMDPGAVTQSEVRKSKHILYISTCMWTLKQTGASDLIYEVEIETHVENICMDAEGEGHGMNWEIRIDSCTLLMKQ